MPKRLWIIAAVTILTGCQTQTTETKKKVAFEQLAPKTTLTVTSPDITANQPIPEQFTAYGANKVPTITWSTPPPGTKTLLLLVEDPDAPADKPYVHYLVYNIPPATTSLGATPPKSATIGANTSGDLAYFGPRPPSGRHLYHFEVFALSVDLTPPSAATFDTLLPKIQGNILAGGELIAPYEKK